MKKCPFCSKLLQISAHHCHHCSSNLIDMDGNPIGKPAEIVVAPELEKLELGIKISITVFFTVTFFIIGLIFSSSILGMSILELKSLSSIFFHLFLLLISITGAILLSPPVIKWIKAFLG